MLLQANTRIPGAWTCKTSHFLSPPSPPKGLFLVNRIMGSIFSNIATAIGSAIYFSFLFFSPFDNKNPWKVLTTPAGTSMAMSAASSTNTGASVRHGGLVRGDGCLNHHRRRSDGSGADSHNKQGGKQRGNSLGADKRIGLARRQTSPYVYRTPMYAKKQRRLCQCRFDIGPEGPQIK
jgi:hypothetical protein